MGAGVVVISIRVSMTVVVGNVNRGVIDGENPGVALEPTLSPGVILDDPGTCVVPGLGVILGVGVLKLAGMVVEELVGV